MEPPMPYFPLDPHGTSSLLQDVKFLVETQRQTTRRHGIRAQEPEGYDEADKELDRRIAENRVRSDVARLTQLVQELQRDLSEKRASWRHVALGLSIPTVLLNTHSSTRGFAAVTGAGVLYQSLRREVSPFVAARLEHQLASLVGNAGVVDLERLLAMLESWEWKFLRYL
ncbi:hypothetical protein QBC47DRAFT_418774 [Echria macrotheca]|uniref:Uncharacterized protein n=1 Tax=Echria macrotheca TaxID=438768 RepID=A0AAJ0F044_9PEZI|nr:hypothetical protein QBC47DRAFT_418774 [Echria macrotheca]